MRYKNIAINELLDDNKITQEEYNILFKKLEYKDNFLAALKKVLLLFENEEHIHLDYISFPNNPELSNFYTYIIDILHASSINNLKEIKFKECHFYSDIKIREVPIKYHLHFGEATFHKKVDFNKSIFEKRIDFLETNFKEDITFGGVKFQDEAHFWKSNADKLIAFQSITCSKIFSINKLGFQKIDMDNAQFKEVNFIDLVGRENNKDISLNKTHFDNKETTIILRTHLEKENYISEANKYFKIGQELYIDYLLGKDNTAPNRYSTLIVLYLNKFISNHQTSWEKVLFWIIFFSFLVLLLHDYSPCWEECLKNKGACLKGIFSWDTLNRMVELINPANMFKNTNILYQDKEFIGTVVRIFTLYLFYQFSIAFRQNTRRK